WRVGSSDHRARAGVTNETLLSTWAGMQCARRTRGALSAPEVPRVRLGSVRSCGDALGLVHGGSARASAATTPALLTPRVRSSTGPRDAVAPPPSVTTDRTR